MLCHCCACFTHRATMWISYTSGRSNRDTAYLPFCHLGAASTFTGSVSLEKEDYQATDWVQSCGYTAVWSKINTGVKWKLFHPLFQSFLSATSLMPKAVFIQLHTSQVSKMDRAQKMAYLRDHLQPDSFLTRSLHSNMSTSSCTREGQKSAARPGRRTGHSIHGAVQFET